MSDYSVGQVFEAGDTIEVPAGQSLTLYFADGSKSVLGESGTSTILKLDAMAYPEENSLISRISLVLQA